MTKKHYFWLIFVSVFLIIVIFAIYRIGTNNSNDETNTNNGVENVGDTKNYSDKQIKKAEKSNENEEKVEEKIREYIIQTEAPKNQEEYDNALKMRSSDEQNNLKKDVSDLTKDKDRSVKDLNVTVDYDNPKEMSGSYQYTLTYSKDERQMTKDKNGDFTLKTNDDGYFYLNTFN